MTHLKGLIVAGLLGCATQVAAVDGSGIFFGGSLGFADHDEDGSALTTALAGAPVAANFKLDDNDFMWKAFFGYNLTDNFGVELGYVDLGETTAKVNVTAPVAGSAESVAGISGYTILALARFPLYERFELLGKFGGIFSEVDVSNAATGALAVTATSADDDELNIAAGVGIKYTFTETVGVRLDWDRYMSVGEADNDIDAFSLGVEFEF